jgi:hypothetical protein
MDVNDVMTFLEGNTDLKGNDTAIRNALIEMDSSSWWNGYNASLKHAKKRKAISEKRIRIRVSRLIDFISDLTHRKDKK